MLIWTLISHSCIIFYFCKQFHEDIQAAALDAMEKSTKIIRYSFLSQDFFYFDVKATIYASKTKICKQNKYIDLD